MMIKKFLSFMSLVLAVFILLHGVVSYAGNADRETSKDLEFVLSFCDVQGQEGFIDEILAQSKFNRNPINGMSFSISSGILFYDKSDKLSCIDKLTVFYDTLTNDVVSIEFLIKKGKENYSIFQKAFRSLSGEPSYVEARIEDTAFFNELCRWGMNERIIDIYSKDDKGLLKDVASGKSDFIVKIDNLVGLKYLPENSPVQKGSKDVEFILSFCSNYAREDLAESILPLMGFSENFANDTSRSLNLGILTFDNSDDSSCISKISISSNASTKELSRVAFFIKKGIKNYTLFRDVFGFFAGSSSYVASQIKNGMYFHELYRWTINGSNIDIYAETIVDEGLLRDVTSGRSDFVVRIDNPSNLKNVFPEKKPTPLNTETSFTIRKNIYFGMKKEDIIKIEGAPSATNDSTLAYNSSAALLDASLFFTFGEERLFMISYVFSEEHSEENLHLKDYEKLEESLNAKYGEPSSSGEVWINDLYKDDVFEYGFAISAGHLQYTSVWELPDVIITHSIFGDNFEISHLLIYEAPKSDEYKIGWSDGI